MRVHLMVEKDHISITARAEGPGLIGDARWTLKPGEPFGTYSYETLKEMGTGAHDLRAGGIPCDP